jgi:hypothetical protein
VKPGDRRARDRDEDKREHRARKNRAGAVDELRKSRHLEARRDRDDGDGENSHDPDF